MNLQYQVNENPPTFLSIGLASQMVLLTIAGIVLTPAIVIQAGGGSAGYLEYAVFAVLIISGLSTILQARPIWRLGSGHVLMMGTSGAFIAVCISAIEHGGPFLLGLLVLTSSIVQFAFAAKLSLLRKIFTPTVGGIVLMLIPVTVMPIAFDMMSAVAVEHQSFNAPIVTLITVLVGVGLGIRAKGLLRLWTPIIGILAGVCVAIPLGMFDATKVNAASWIGFPSFNNLEFNFTLDSTFWVLLPSFVFVTIIGMVETIGDSIAIQRVSHRELKAPDYRVVQGAVAADGFGNLLSGLMCVVPNTTYSSSIAVTELTGVASRRIGIFIGIGFLIAAFVPKLQTLIVSIPTPVMGGYLFIILGMLFVVGMKMVARGGLDYRTGLIVGVSIWLGVGFQFQYIFPNLFVGFWGELFQNGMTVGGLTAIFLTMLWHITSSRTRKTQTPLNVEALSVLSEFIEKYSAAWNLSETVQQNLRLANEETLLLLRNQSCDVVRNIQLSFRKELNIIALEYLVAADLDNIEDKISILQEAPNETNEDDFSLKILRHISTQVEHQKYFDLDILTVKVKT